MSGQCWVKSYLLASLSLLSVKAFVIKVWLANQSTCQLQNTPKIEAIENPTFLIPCFEARKVETGSCYRFLTAQLSTCMQARLANDTAGVWRTLLPVIDAAKPALTQATDLAAS
jgi:hypothetical protein